MSHIAYENNGLWSVANSEEILCYLVTREEAAELLGDDANSVLVPAPAETWFPTLLSALQFTTGNVQGSLAEFQQKHESEQLEKRMSNLSSVLSKVANDVGTIGREIERQQQERAEQAEAERLQAEHEAITAPLWAEHKSLSAELKKLNTWLNQQLTFLRTKSSFRAKASMSDLARTKQYQRASEIRKRLAQLESELAQ